MKKLVRTTINDNSTDLLLFLISNYSKNLKYFIFTFNLLDENNQKLTLYCNCLRFEEITIKNSDFNTLYSFEKVICFISYRPDFENQNELLNEVRKFC